jgi:PadR family transcriptional regulator PadR
VTTYDTQMLKGVLSLLLLHLVAVREDYGYSLVLRLRESGFLEISEGTVYPGLTRLEAAGLLDSELVRSRSGPARKYYRATDEGRAELARSAESWAALARAVDTILNTGSAG